MSDLDYPERRSGVHSWRSLWTCMVRLPICEGIAILKFVDNMTDAQRTDAARSVLILESAVALVQVIIAMVTGNAASWFAAMFVIVLGTIAWVVLTPDE
jgi:hypothetical protein